MKDIRLKVEYQPKGFFGWRLAGDHCFTTSSTLDYRLGLETRFRNLYLEDSRRHRRLQNLDTDRQPRKNPLVICLDHSLPSVIVLYLSDHVGGIYNGITLQQNHPGRQRVENCTLDPSQFRRERVSRDNLEISRKLSPGRPRGL